MNTAELIEVVQQLVSGFQDTIFTGFCIMLAFSLAYGVKRIVLE